MKALILVDLQVDFAPGGALAVPEGDGIVSLVNDLQERFELVVATQDWHPADHLSFAGNHGRNPGEVVRLGKCDQVLWPDHCVQGTGGAAFLPGLRQEGIDRVFRKGEDRRVDSYSGFYDNDGVRQTGLSAYLKERGVTAVYIAGLATDYCVKFTALDACRLGFDTYVIVDASRGVNLNPGDVDRALEEMASRGIRLIESDALLSR